MNATYIVQAITHVYILFVDVPISESQIWILQEVIFKLKLLIICDSETEDQSYLLTYAPLILNILCDINNMYDH